MVDQTLSCGRQHRDHALAGVGLGGLTSDPDAPSREVGVVTEPPTELRDPWPEEDERLHDGPTRHIVATRLLRLLVPDQPATDLTYQRVGDAEFARECDRGFRRAADVMHLFPVQPPGLAIELRGAVEHRDDLARLQIGTTRPLPPLPAFGHVRDSLDQSLPVGVAQDAQVGIDREIDRGVRQSTLAAPVGPAGARIDVVLEQRSTLLARRLDRESLIDQRVDHSLDGPFVDLIDRQRTEMSRPIETWYSSSRARLRSGSAAA